MFANGTAHTAIRAIAWTAREMIETDTFADISKLNSQLALVVDLRDLKFLRLEALDNSADYSAGAPELIAWSRLDSEKHPDSVDLNDPMAIADVGISMPCARVDEFEQRIVDLVQKSYIENVSFELARELVKSLLQALRSFNYSR
jgi:hypothetical protein